MKQKINIQYRAVVKKNIKINGKQYKKGFVLIDGMFKSDVDTIISSNLCYDIIGHGDYNYFDVKKDIDILKITETVSTKIEKIKI